MCSVTIESAFMSVASSRPGIALLISFEGVLCEGGLNKNCYYRLVLSSQRDYGPSNHAVKSEYLTGSNLVGWSNPFKSAMYVPPLRLDKSLLNIYSYMHSFLLHSMLGGGVPSVLFELREKGGRFHRHGHGICSFNLPVVENCRSQSKLIYLSSTLRNTDFDNLFD